jgi:hypothetical protein
MMFERLTNRLAEAQSRQRGGPIQQLMRFYLGLIKRFQTLIQEIQDGGKPNTRLKK